MLNTGWLESFMCIRERGMHKIEIFFGPSGGSLGRNESSLNLQNGDAHLSKVQKWFQGESVLLI